MSNRILAPRSREGKNDDLIADVNLFELPGSQYGLYNKLEFTMEKDIKLKLGTDTISLLSATVGLAV